ncbi:YecA family protein [Amphibiibacter pelophylacis]|uniref:YecA family protein n=1 Tax=Amphibiibacter pelophylacis TaxID=1799477 RepID=A0ACC6P2X9_9BURK
MTEAPLPPLDDDALQRLDDLLQRITPDDGAFDLSALDGFLVGVALQPRPVPPAQWLPFLHDADGRPWPEGARSHAGLNLAQRDELARSAHQRLAQLQQAIRERQWFDPWLMADPEDEDDLGGAVAAWVAGFSVATNAFEGLLSAGGSAKAQQMVDALALLYRHLDPDDVDLEPELQDAIEALEPPMQAEDLVEDLVCATLLLADISQPVKTGSAKAGTHPRRAGPAGGPPRSKKPARPPARGG